MIYTYPKTAERDFYFLRWWGPGLGNILFPWARSAVAARLLGGRPIFPCWPQIRLRALARFRWSRDSRTYARLFRNPGTYADGFEKLRAVLRLPRLPESCLSEGRLPENGIIVFEEREGLFNPILNEHALVRDELISITRPEHLKGLLAARDDSIAVHVRLGDFAIPESGESQIRSGAPNLRIPLAWYRNVIAACRRALGYEVSVRIFSDGSDEELRPLLDTPGVRRASFGTSIGDLLALSAAPLFIASGSTFSMWASYLGRMPVIWYPGHLKCRLYCDQPQAEIELDAGDDLPESFVECLRLPQTRAQILVGVNHGYRPGL
jgi:hypothetical protein